MHLNYFALEEYSEFERNLLVLTAHLKLPITTKLELFELLKQVRLDSVGVSLMHFDVSNLSKFFESSRNRFDYSKYIYYSFIPFVLVILVTV
jgi:hypothetical protein